MHLSYLFIAVLGLHCCMGFSLVAATLWLQCASCLLQWSCCRAQAPGLAGFSSCDTRAQQSQHPGSQAQIP